LLIRAKDSEAVSSAGEAMNRQKLKYTENTTVFRQRKPLTTPKFQTNVIQDSNPDCWINPDLHLDVCRIFPKMLWIQLPCWHQSFCQAL